jgi:hypothetical protein
MPVVVADESVVADVVVSGVSLPSSDADAEPVKRLVTETDAVNSGDSVDEAEVDAETVVILEPVGKSEAELETLAPSVGEMLPVPRAVVESKAVFDGHSGEPDCTDDKLGTSVSVVVMLCVDERVGALVVVGVTVALAAEEPDDSFELPEATADDDIEAESVALSV